MWELRNKIGQVFQVEFMDTPKHTNQVMCPWARPKIQIVIPHCDSNKKKEEHVAHSLHPHIGTKEVWGASKWD
jgi:hypothetical protein